MKKTIGLFLIAMCLGISLPTQAQLKFGVKGGLNFSRFAFEKSVYYGGDYAYRSSTRSGFFFGPMAEYAIPNIGLGVNAALLYSQKDLKVENEIGQCRGLELPVNLKYTFGSGSKLGVFVAAGPDFYFDFSDEDAFISFEENMKSIQVGINVGGGVTFMKHYQIGLNYTIPLDSSSGSIYNDMYTPVFPGSKYKIKNLQLSVAYIF